MQYWEIHKPCFEFTNLSICCWVRNSQQIDIFLVGCKAAMSIDLRDLDGELSRTRRKFDEWASRLQEAALDTRQAHQHNMQDQSGGFLTQRHLQAKRFSAQA